MENELTNQITQLLAEYIRGSLQTSNTTPSTASTSNTTPSTASTSNTTPSTASTTTTIMQDRQLDTIYDLHHGYNRVMEQYQMNISNLIRTIHTSQNIMIASNTRLSNRIPTPVSMSGNQTTQGIRHNISQTRVPITPISRPNNQTNSASIPNLPNVQNIPNIPMNELDARILFSYLIQQPQTTDTSSTPLTRTAIAQATRTYGYTEEMSTRDASGNLCPISLEPYQIGDVVCEIIGCNHIFRRPALMNWLRRSSLCPVCRYNLHNYVPTAPDTAAPDTAAPDTAAPDTAAPDTAEHVVPSIPFPQLIDLSGTSIFSLEFEMPLSSENAEESDVSDVEQDLSVD